MPRSASRVSGGPPEGVITVTDVVVVGTGMGGLAVATQLHRKGMAVVVIDGLQQGDPVTAGSLRHATTEELERVAIGDPASHRERRDILRQLHGYAKCHQLDVRRGVVAGALNPAAPAHGTPWSSAMPGEASARRWALPTPGGLIVCDSVVITGVSGRRRVRQFLKAVGQETSDNMATALRHVGIYLVGVGQQVSAGHREVLHQARLVGNAIAGGAQRLPA
ncbi:FAD-binding protein [Arthrobacter sp. Y-9]|uniref:FAD-binding protein n=1 Tax=Arthrobacter sp. Y-9 TaxID=3039385 RepID=UPI00241F57E7|nr:FAD-binding protein [Arthrobacter sp. Y-9]WFR84409.1 FAD-binding protein [Arthrobacter sp. Y-9]